MSDIPKSARFTNVRRNIIANYAGGIWSALMGFAFVPLYVHYLGIESYGLIGFYVSMQVWFALLDMGMSHALSREAARFNAGAHTSASIWALFRSLEVIYIWIAVGISLTVAFSSTWISTHWLRAESLSVSEVSRTLVYIGITISLRWIGALYRGALIGLQRQVWLSSCNAVFATLRNAVVVAVLAWISATVESFFIYQALVGTVELLMLAIGTRRMLPPRSGPVGFSGAAIRQVWSFAGGMAAISILSILLTQVDKMLLSKLLPLSQFGYYTLAYTSASVLHVMTTPVANAAYPQLTELITAGDMTMAAAAYHSFSQLMTLVLVPIAVVLAMFSAEVMLLWTRQPEVVAATAPLFTLITTGNLLNGLMCLPYNLQLAHGWTRFTIRVNAIALILIVPVIYFGVLRYGAVAAAVAWVSLNACYLVIAVPLMHRKLMPTEKWRWYWQDVIVPSSAAIAAAMVVRVLAPPANIEAPLSTAATLLGAGLAAFICAAATLRRVRAVVRGWISIRRA